MAADKTIEVKVRFWTDDLGSEGEVRPKHAWSSGTVYVPANSLHGIKSGKQVNFETIAEIGAAIEKALAAQGVRIHAGAEAHSSLYER